MRKVLVVELRRFVVEERQTDIQREWGLAFMSKWMLGFWEAELGCKRFRSFLSAPIICKNIMGWCKTHVSKIPNSTTACELVRFLERAVGKDTVTLVEIKVNKNSFRPKGYGFVHFGNEEAAEKCAVLAENGRLVLLNSVLKVSLAERAIVQRPQHNMLQLENAALHMCCLMRPDTASILWSSSSNVVTVELDFSNRHLRLLLSAPRDYKMDFRFQDIYSIEDVTVCGTHTRALLLQLWNPPHVYRRKDVSQKTSEYLPGIFSSFSSADPYYFRKEEKEDPWMRATDFTPDKSIGQSLVYVLELPTTVIEQTMNDIFKKLADFRLASYPPVFREISLQTGKAYASSQVLVPIVNAPLGIDVPFELMFKVNQLVQLGNLSGPVLGDEFYWLLQSNVMPLEHAQVALESIINAEDVCWDPVKWVKDEVDEYRKGKRQATSVAAADGLMWVRRLYVSPTKVYCMGPELEGSNRVTRHYKDHIDRFLRVSFVDENFEPVPSTALSVPTRGNSLSGLDAERSEVFDRILTVLRQGVTVGGQKFEFLAFSASQLREQSVWMFASNQALTAQSIRTWMGDFLSIRNVAKCAARMGQCFSSSTPTLEVPAAEVEHIPDIERDDEFGLFRYCFSDGIGKISKAFAVEVAKKCGAKKLQAGDSPSAFQIRYGGYKGVVAVDPKSTFKLSLRPSMRKFASTHVGLDVLSSSRFLPCFLNRQIITLLSTLGVSDSVFEQMQAAVVRQLDAMLKDPEVACEVLQMTNSGGMHTKLVSMLKAGYNPQIEPFVLGLLQAFRTCQLLDLRTKSRIFVPKGRLLMGCLDETKTLNYGEVFVQVTPTPGDRRFVDDGLTQFPKYPLGETKKKGVAYVVTGWVVVAKNPCVHPGDIRKLKAVDVPGLHHMFDCLVFPQKGHRPHPNECSGSDLDGDLYFLSWDEALVPASADNPMDYCPPGQVSLDHPVTVEEIQEFFVKHMVNDSLGTISNAHVVHADREPEMARSAKCEELAKLVSIAVDFPKTGVPAVIPNNLRPHQYPDFMEKEDKETYKSERVLGKLFRFVKEAANQQLPTSSISKADIVQSFDPQLRFNGYEDFLEEASVHKNWYDRKLIGLMNQYGIETEAEAISGNIMRLSRHYCKRNGAVNDRIRESIDCLEKEARSWFESHDLAEENETCAKASAWYYVTYHPNYIANGEYFAAGKRKVHLLSFPWVVCDVLLRIKRFKQALQ